MNYKNRKRAYYAHCMKIYDTEEEKTVLNFLKKHFNVICPNNDIGKLEPFSRYLNIVRWADIVIVSEYGGYLTAGVFAEAKYALENNIPVFLIHPSNHEFSLIKVVKVNQRGERLNDVQYGSVETIYDKEGSTLLQGING